MGPGSGHRRARFIGRPSQRRSLRSARCDGARTSAAANGLPDFRYLGDGHRWHDVLSSRRGTESKFHVHAWLRAHRTIDEEYGRYVRICHEDVWLEGFSSVERPKNTAVFDPRPTFCGIKDWVAVRPYACSEACQKNLLRRLRTRKFSKCWWMAVNGG